VSRPFLNERDQDELDEYALRSNRWLAGLVETHGWRAVDDAARRVCGYPAHFIDMAEEAIEVATALTHKD
jgi:hypothetical protein